jgi:hypothetical protein
MGIFYSRMRLLICFLGTLFLLAFLLADEAALLSARIQASPRLPFERTEIRVKVNGLGYPSAVTMDAAGRIYVLQREQQLDPVMVVNTSGKILHSWGRGLFAVPHSIRLDPQGNVWTVDSSSSQVHKFTPRGEKLMTIGHRLRPERAPLHLRRLWQCPGSGIHGRRKAPQRMGHGRRRRRAVSAAARHRHRRPGHRLRR